MYPFTTNRERMIAVDGVYFLDKSCVSTVYERLTGYWSMDGIG